jgi:hypothetical protein
MNFKLNARCLQGMSFWVFPAVLLLGCNGPRQSTLPGFLQRVQARYASIDRYSDVGSIDQVEFDVKSTRSTTFHRTGTFIFRFNRSGSINYVYKEAAVPSRHLSATEFDVTCDGSRRVFTIGQVDAPPIHKSALAADWSLTKNGRTEFHEDALDVALDADPLYESPFHTLMPLLLPGQLEPWRNPFSSIDKYAIVSPDKGSPHLVAVSSMGTIWFDSKSLLLMKSHRSNDTQTFHPVAEFIR